MKNDEVLFLIVGLIFGHAIGFIRGMKFVYKAEQVIWDMLHKADERYKKLWIKYENLLRQDKDDADWWK